MSINNNEPEKKEIKNEKSNAKIIDELPKNDIHKIKNIKTVYRLIFVFRNENNSIEVKPDSKIISSRQYFKQPGIFVLNLLSIKHSYTLSSACIE